MACYLILVGLRSTNYGVSSAPAVRQAISRRPKYMHMLCQYKTAELCLFQGGCNGVYSHHMSRAESTSARMSNAIQVVILDARVSIESATKRFFAGRRGSRREGEASYTIIESIESVR